MYCFKYIQCQYYIFKQGREFFGCDHVEFTGNNCELDMLVVNTSIYNIYIYIFV